MEDKETKEERKEYTMSLYKANLYAFFMIFPILVIYAIPYIFLWENDDFQPGKRLFIKLFVIIFLGGIVLHELLHGLTWSLFARNGLKSIQFGIKWQYLTPYCHCKEGLKLNHYRLVGIMPLILMGIVPAIYSIYSGSGFWLIFGTFYTWAAGGDILALFMTLKIPAGTVIYDHPSEMGFYTIDSRY